MKVILRMELSGEPHGVLLAKTTIVNTAGTLHKLSYANIKIDVVESLD